MSASTSIHLKLELSHARIRSTSVKHTSPAEVKLTQNSLWMLLSDIYTLRSFIGLNLLDLSGLLATMLFACVRQYLVLWGLTLFKSSKRMICARWQKRLYLESKNTKF